MELPPFRLERFFARFEFSVPYMLAASDCETVTIGELLQETAGGAEAFLQQRLGYTEPQGHPELRHLIATLYQKLPAQSVLACSGAEEAIFLAMNALLGPGDHVIVQSPCYQSLAEIPRAIGCAVSEWRAEAESEWLPDLPALEALVRRETRMLVVNFPHNPTGALATPEQYRQIVGVARANQLVLLSDEVYRGLEYQAAERLAPATDLYDQAISIGVLSKAYGLAGLRIGWLACRNPEMMSRIARQRDYTTICNSAASELLAIAALRQREKLIERNRAIIQENLKRLCEFAVHFSDLLTFIAPKAGCVAFPRFRRKGMGPQFYDWLAEKHGILLLPGSCFDRPDEFFRIGFGRRDFVAGLLRLADFLGESRLEWHS